MPVPHIRSAPPSGLGLDILSLMFSIWDIIGTAGQNPGPPHIHDTINNGPIMPSSRITASTPDFHVIAGVAPVPLDMFASLVVERGDIKGTSLRIMICRTSVR